MVSLMKIGYQFAWKNKKWDEEMKMWNLHGMIDTKQMYAHSLLT